MRIILTGSSGLIGTALAHRLQHDHHEVVRLVRRTPRPGEARWDPDAGTIDHAALRGADAVVHLAGAGIGDKRWSDEYKRILVESRTKSTSLLATTIAEMDEAPKVFLSGSAIGYYGAHGDEQLSEASPAGNDFLADLCCQWEVAAQPASDAGVRTVFLRTGIVLSPKGGALSKLMPLFRFGLGGKMGNGKQWQSWIAIDDHVAALEHLLKSSLHGPVNLTAPNPVTNAEMTTTLARVLHRPAFFPVPKFGPKLLLGGELAEALLFTGQRVLPTRLSDDGFQFGFPVLEGALRHLLEKPTGR